MESASFPDQYNIIFVFEWQVKLISLLHVSILNALVTGTSAIICKLCIQLSVEW